MIIEYPEGATPLEPEELEQLLVDFISTQNELNAAEQMNIAQAQIWLSGRKVKPVEILSEDFLRELHRRMFGNVWEWAGRFRTTEKNIGIDPRKVAVELHKLFGDVRYQLEHEVYTPTETAIRFHHRLVLIHPFVNGNGRHSRIMTDFLLGNIADESLSWDGGIEDYSNDSDTRKKYIQSLRMADKGAYRPLLDLLVENK